jgi:hypothetical protein
MSIASGQVGILQLLALQLSAKGGLGHDEEVAGNTCAMSYHGLGRAMQMCSHHTSITFAHKHFLATIKLQCSQTCECVVVAELHRVEAFGCTV